MNHKGFSIAELAAVIGIIGLLAIVSLPMLVSYQKTTKLRNEARVLATNIRYAQQLAITEQAIYDVKFYITTDSYQIINSNTSAVIMDVGLDAEVSIGEVDSLTDNTIQFNPTGAVLETGYIALTNSKNQTSTLDIKPSGYVEIIE